MFLCEGAIELSILADYYGREIAAYDIQTTRCDLYGQVSHFNYSERVMLIYDGLHYDALVSVKGKTHYCFYCSAKLITS
ncbi:ubiquitin thioesterase OTU1 [Cajanus cajan]|uniref:ubiquitin thioesterase OTU1 n=1 Tax=Cajanus cajan TaxID=3821 RepID=UPI00098DC5B5|nr:ubiquitin thioesterase OTU1 [Cajanus cajan]